MAEDAKRPRGKQAIDAALQKRLRAPAVSPIDGINRTEKSEKALNQVFAVVFRGSNGTKVLNYLKNISINRITGPGNIDPNAIVHLEGTRYLYGVIKARTDKGKAQK